jgi:hypothetical protein
MFGYTFNPEAISPKSRLPSGRVNVNNPEADVQLKKLVMNINLLHKNELVGGWQRLREGVM